MPTKKAIPAKELDIKNKNVEKALQEAIAMQRKLVKQAGNRIAKLPGLGS